MATIQLLPNALHVVSAAIIVISWMEQRHTCSCIMTTSMRFQGVIHCTDRLICLLMSIIFMIWFSSSELQELARVTFLATGYILWKLKEDTYHEIKKQRIWSFFDDGTNFTRTHPIREHIQSSRTDRMLHQLSNSTLSIQMDYGMELHWDDEYYEVWRTVQIQSTYHY